MLDIALGLSAQRTLTVQAEHTASRWGSGALQVLSTPHMIALMEGAAVDAVDHLLPEGRQTVGIRIDVRHLAATPIGGRVAAVAHLIEIDGRRLVFSVEARDQAGEIGRGEHERFVIDVARFMAKASARVTGAPAAS